MSTPRTVEPHAVVVGAGIGGLCAAIGLRRRGWDVTVLERAPEFRPVGAGITLLANGMRGLDALGVGDAVRAQGTPAVQGGLRTPDGRWILRVDAAAVERELGTAGVGIHRATLHRVLLDQLPAGAVRTGAEVVDVGAGRNPHVVVRSAGGSSETLDAALVVGADGIRSGVRARLWPGAPGPVHSGSTAWRAVTREPWPGPLDTAITWGPGVELGMVPLGDGRVYWFCAATSAPGGRAEDGDELGAVRALVAGWHDPVPALLDATDPGAVLRAELLHLGGRLRSYHRGAVALLGDAAHAMVPHLGQGANQAIEDAVVLASLCDPLADVPHALAVYDEHRRPRSQRVARAAAQAERFGQQLTHPVALAVRNGLARRVPPALALRSTTSLTRWTPPAVPSVHS
jgi:2-polyprenyl-6-methoxyphenol hydroxylase-like FAD-dependent oxidoreductase